METKDEDIHYDTKTDHAYKGVLRDEEGIVRALFSGPSDAWDAKSTELGAIITALDVFIDMGWKGS
ncbi:hypothetical protein J1N35_029457, partial [Gossypium stocksii]